MKKVYSRQEARDWFIENHSRSVICVSVIDAEEIKANCFPVADKFYRAKAASLNLPEMKGTEEKMTIDDKNAES